MTSSDDGSDGEVWDRRRYMREYMRRRRAEVLQQEVVDVRQAEAVEAGPNSPESSSSGSDVIPSSSEDDENNGRQFTFAQRLSVWKASNMSVTQTAMTSLLQILRTQGHVGLPSDARTLMNSPRRVETVNGENGVYHIRDVKSVLNVLLERNLQLRADSSRIPLQFSSDGVSIFSSSAKEFYPVMLKINDPRSPPVLYALHFGKRPHPNFYRACLEPLLPFLTLGWDREEGHIDVVIESVIADLPCRQLLKQIRGHAGYSACEFCHVQAERHERTMVYPGLAVLPLRSDAEFCLKSDPMHHLPESTSPFVEVSLLNVY